MKQKGLITETEMYFKSRIFTETPELFESFKEYYPLDRVVIEQLKKMSSSEIRGSGNGR